MGEQTGARGFWSYAREDNRLDDGAILKLATALEQEFNLIAGRPLKLFVDRNSIEWGDEWRQRIDLALNEAVFFIPVLTPRYFTRIECRRELLDFYGRAKSVGLERLMLPILYVDVPDFTGANQDEAVALIARIQSVDWRSLRLEGLTSPEHRKSVHQLAKRLNELELQANEIQLARELDPSHADGSGIHDVVQEIDGSFADWLKAVLGDKVNSAQMNATYEQHKDHLARLRARRSPRSAILATQLRFGPDILPLAERFLRDAQVYLARSSQINPLMLTLIRQLKEHPEESSLANHILEGIADAVDNFTDPETKHGRHYLSTINHLSQTINKAEKCLETAQAFVSQGNEIVAGWWNNGLGEIVEQENFLPLSGTPSGYWTKTDSPNKRRIIIEQAIDASS
ncbi:toll/interleukin-1 receptor domain-containing protein [Micromonospora sp. NPDC050784]|uniref:toll/interleukin-1 receptor domain-containing protein n=1 Tax=Micromonospora sp. NPDC050784 TaxID=3364281 RepID=UPI0037B71810